MPRSVFVTGAAGFIGSHVSEALLARGDRVFGFDNFDPFYDRRIKERNLAPLSAHPSFSFLEGDIRDAPALARWGAGTPPDALIHLAAKAGVRPSVADPAGYADVNVRGTVRVLEWARERRVPKVLFASSSSVYGGNTKVPFSEADFVDPALQSALQGAELVKELMTFSRRGQDASGRASGVGFDRDAERVALPARGARDLLLLELGVFEGQHGHHRGARPVDFERQLEGPMLVMAEEAHERSMPPPMAH